MRYARLTATLAFIALSIGTFAIVTRHSTPSRPIHLASGSAATRQDSFPVIRWRGFAATTTSTTTTTIPPTTTTRPTPPTTIRRRVVVTQAPQRATTPIPGVDNGSDCGSGWRKMQLPAKIAKAHRCWDDLIAQYGWDTHRAFSVMMCESEGDPTEYNASGATGLFQVLMKGASFDPTTNVSQAYHDKYQSAGNSWSPWSPSQSCWSHSAKG